MLDSRNWLRDTGYWKRDAGLAIDALAKVRYRILDFAFCILDK